jgi:hypothetical protein
MFSHYLKRRHLFKTRFHFQVTKCITICFKTYYMGSYKLVLYLKLLVVNFIGVPTCEDKILSRPF